MTSYVRSVSALGSSDVIGHDEARHKGLTRTPDLSSAAFLDGRNERIERGA
jgi:hypothetical protein